MYIGFVNDQKQVRKFLKLKYKKGRKRNCFITIIFVTSLAFAPLKASAKNPDYSKTTYETVIPKYFIRGGFSPHPINMETLGRNLSQEYKNYQKEFNSPNLSKRFDTLKFSKERFLNLAKDPNASTEVYHKTTIDEARSALQAEMARLIDNVERIPQPYCKQVDLDFQIAGPAPFTHLDMKHPVGTKILKKQGRNIKLSTMVSDLGESITNQKKRFCVLEQGPKDSKNVLHIVDLCYIPTNEKQIVKDSCVKAAGSSEGILFINTQ